MPSYEICCKECEHHEDWICSVDEYKERIIEECPSCHNKSLYQYFGNWKEVPVHFKGFGWSQGIYSKKFRRGSKEDMEQAEAEHDYLQEVADKNDGIPKNVAEARIEKIGAVSS